MTSTTQQPVPIRADRREKLLRIFGRDDVDRVLKSLISCRGLSVLTDKAVDELIRLTIADFKHARKLNALHRQIHRECPS
ncbi:MAG: hypothetical protein JWM36_4372 [Hyphomicrobiales bacterium]|nr:hypothetical protein [Hyphomicrobiales bacterium]